MWDNITTNAVGAFSGDLIWLHVVGAAATYAISKSDTDYRVHNFFHNHDRLSTLMTPAAVLGGLAPLALPIGIYVSGKKSKNRRTLGAAGTVWQASAIALSYVTILKTLTGRPYPYPDTPDGPQTLSKKWQFGFGRGGIFWGWPSGHAITTTAWASALMECYPEKRCVQVGGYSMMGYMMVGVSAIGGGRMHWFSDTIAGTLMGYAIGTTVGRYFRRAYLGEFLPSSEAGISFAPIFAPDVTGIRDVFRF